MTRDKPELTPGPGVTTAPDIKNVMCPSCSMNFALRSDMDTESEEIAEYTTRTDYWCSNCGEHIGTRTDYHGPVPVETGPGIYETQ